MASSCDKAIHCCPACCTKTIQFVTDQVHVYKLCINKVQPTNAHPCRSTICVDLAVWYNENMITCLHVTTGLKYSYTHGWHRAHWTICWETTSQTGQFAEIITHNWMKIEIRNHSKHNIKVHKMCIFQSIPWMTTNLFVGKSSSCFIQPLQCAGTTTSASWTITTM